MFDSGHRLPDAAHLSRPWRIHEFTKDFRLLDVWALPTPGAADDFPRLVRLMGSFDPGQSSIVVRGLFAIRFALGRLLGLDRPQTGLGERVSSLRDRLPDELLDATPDPGFGGFVPLYTIGDEVALEIANETVHGVLHVGWVSDGANGFRGQMASWSSRMGYSAQRT